MSSWRPAVSLHTSSLRLSTCGPCRTSEEQMPVEELQQLCIRACHRHFQKIGTLPCARGERGRPAVPWTHGVEVRGTLWDRCPAARKICDASPHATNLVRYSVRRIHEAQHEQP